MNGHEYQRAIQRTNGTTEWYQQLGARLFMQTKDKSLGELDLELIHACLGLSGEVGEVTDAVKKHVLYNRPLDIGNVKEECGDILWYMALLLNTIGSSFEEVMQMNVDKLNKRYPQGYNDKAAQERADKAAT